MARNYLGKSWGQDPKNCKCQEDANLELARLMAGLEGGQCHQSLKSSFPLVNHGNCGCKFMVNVYSVPLFYLALLYFT